MSSETKFETIEEQRLDTSRKKVNLTSLMLKLNEEKRKERNSNLALSVAAVSAVTVFGIILSL